MKLIDEKCFECGEGMLKPSVVTRSYTIDGRKIRVPGLIVLCCTKCGEKSWPDSELQRGRQIAALKNEAAA